LDHIDPNDPDITQHVSDVLTSKVNEMILEVKEEYDLKNGFDQMNGRDANGNILPLIRLRVFRGEYASINVQRFGSQFIHKVANPKSILQFAKQRVTSDKKKNAKRRLGEVAFDLDDVGEIEDNAMGRSKMEDIVKNRLSEPDSKLTLLPESAFTYAVHQFVNKGAAKAISNFVQDSLEDSLKALTKDKSFSANASSLNLEGGDKVVSKALKKRHKEIDRDIAKKRRKEKGQNNEPDDNGSDSDNSSNGSSSSDSDSDDGGKNKKKGSKKNATKKNTKASSTSSSSKTSKTSKTSKNKLKIWKF
jgi:double-strand break repair protein MRE11